MNLSNEISQYESIFIDTAPIIYYIEAHPQFGPLLVKIVNSFQSGRVLAFSSVITLTEVLVKPFEHKDERLVRKFSEFLKFGKNFVLVEISAEIAERAGKLKGKYPNIKTIDALQISAAIDVDADVFITNDKKLKQINELKILVLMDYLQSY